MNAGFTHLHVHSEFSLLDGACKISQIPKRIAELGQTSVAITDHGAMYGVIDFYKNCRSVGVKPIIGCEVYTAARTRFDKEHRFDSESGHLILLAENSEGYSNLIKLVSDSWIDGFYFKPRIDMELLYQYRRGLIALSACLAGDVSRAILREGVDSGKRKAAEFLQIFGKDHFYLEIQDHMIPEQKTVIAGMEKISRELGIDLVATNDAHYIDKADADLQFTLMCIQMGKTVEDGDRLGFAEPEFYLKSTEEMRNLFVNYPEALDNTSRIAQRCDVSFKFGELHLPKYSVPTNDDPYSYLRKLCEQGLTERYSVITPELSSRLNYELETIYSMGYVDYFLIVYDFIKYAKDKGIPVGPGRGSAAGSIVSYCLFITDVDPIKFGLLFERFLNPERISMPDIDVDFCNERREEVIDYVVQKYGHDHVAQIVTFGTMGAKLAVRDVGRALNIPYSNVDAIAKMIPNESDIKLDRALKISNELSVAYESGGETKKLIDTARGLEGMPRHTSTHAAGVVITSEPVSEYIPLMQNDGTICTQFTMSTLEELGLLKMDFLGLRNLTVIEDAERMIREKCAEYSPDQIDFEDSGVFQMLSDGHTNGVFQLESAGMRQVIINLKPQSIEDITAVISLYRPGPMDSIPRYIENKHSPEKITYLTPLLEPILHVTYGCIVYQEQVMQIVTALAGYSFGRADLVRRVMSKKQPEAMEREREYFLYGKVSEDGQEECCGAIKNGVPEKIANQIFDEMSDFAKYAFNKSHAVCYAVISYRTAYLKYHYPKDYMAALLSSVLVNTDKLIEYIGECNRMDICVLPPDVNKSEAGFHVCSEGIRFGLVAVKNVGRTMIDNLVKERIANGLFAGLADFCERMHDKDLNKRSLDSLIQCGALDCFGAKRSQLLAVSGETLDRMIRTKKKNLDGQIDFFSSLGTNDLGDDPSEDILFPDIAEFSREELLSMEKQITGLYLSGHPMYEYEGMIREMGCATTREIIQAFEVGAMGQYRDGQSVKLAGVVSSKKSKITKRNETMAFLSIEDMHGSIEVLVFPQVLAKFYAEIEVGAILVISGRIDARDEGDVKLLMESALPIDHLSREDRSPSARPSKLQLNVSSDRKLQYAKALQIMSIFTGDLPVEVSSNGKRLSAEMSSIKPLPKVQLNKTLLSELQRLLGKENVRIV